jgi:FRG domain
MTSTTFTAVSVSQFLGLTGDLIENANLVGATMEFLYRGVADAEHKLIPSLYRCEVDPWYEREIYREFLGNCRPHLPYEPTDYIEWLFLMQHYGLPTRLLDWSESSLVALFFAAEDACKGEDCSRDGAIWVLDPWHLNQLTSKNMASIPHVRSERLADYRLNVFGKDVQRKVKAGHPMAIRADRPFARSLNQRAVATIHGHEQIALEHMESTDCLRAKIVIPAQCKVQILKDLTRMGVSHSVIYPDLDGLSKAIRFRFGHHFMG